MAGWRGLEPPTSGVTGQRCNQLYYHPANSRKSKILYARIEIPWQEWNEKIRPKTKQMIIYLE